VKQNLAAASSSNVSQQIEERALVSAWHVGMHGRMVSTHNGEVLVPFVAAGTA